LESTFSLAFPSIPPIPVLEPDLQIILSEAAVDENL